VVYIVKFIHIKFQTLPENCNIRQNM